MDQKSSHHVRNLSTHSITHIFKKHCTFIGHYGTLLQNLFNVWNKDKLFHTAEAATVHEILFTIFPSLTIYSAYRQRSLKQELNTGAGVKVINLGGSLKNVATCDVSMTMSCDKICSRNFSAFVGNVSVQSVSDLVVRWVWRALPNRDRFYCQCDSSLNLATPPAPTAVLRCKCTGLKF